jgi:DNA-directed RNA polymerase subunit RPC12/RpoP
MTRFYCCESMQKQLSKEDHLEYWELYQYGYKYCPYCGNRILR